MGANLFGWDSRSPFRGFSRFDLLGCVRQRAGPHGVRESLHAAAPWELASCPTISPPSGKARSPLGSAHEVLEADVLLRDSAADAGVRLALPAVEESLIQTVGRLYGGQTDG